MNQPSSIFPAFGLGSPTPFLPPVMLADSISILSASQLDFRSDAFVNKRHGAIEVHGLRVVSTYTGAGVTDWGVAPAAALSLSIAFDGKPLTRSFVPVWLMGPSRNRVAEEYYGTAAQTPASFQIDFPFPIYVPPGKGFTVSARHMGYTPYAASVSLSFVGRAVQKPTSQVRRLPYAVHWQSTQFNPSDSGVIQSAPPGALANDLKRDFTVERIMGRPAYFYQLTGLNFLSDLDVGDSGGSAIAVKLGVAAAKPILSTYTPAPAVFGMSGAIEAPFVLKPGGYVTVDVQHSSYSLFVVTSQQDFFGASLVGWREE